MITIVEHQIDSDEARSLIHELDAELCECYHKESVHGVEAKSFIEAGGKFFIAKLDSKYVGCVAMRPFDESSAEIKRMYVRKAYRGRGISRLLLDHIESCTQGLGYSRILVETGDRQPEAQALFRSNGYHQIDPFGEYLDDPHSVCFKKEL